MPQIIPTREEMTRMTPRQRDRARRAIWAILAETDKHIERQSRVRDDNKAFGEAVRQRARDLEAYTPKDPPWVTAARQRALLEATS